MKNNHYKGKERSDLFLVFLFFYSFNICMAQNNNLPPLPSETVFKTPAIVSEKETITFSDPIANSDSKPKTLNANSYLEAMRKKGAEFYYNTDKITANKAIELVTNIKKLNISSQTNNNKTKVYLSKEGTTILNGKLVEQKD